jgi:predicted MPP superfamily phosphohydrolase
MESTLAKCACATLIILSQFYSYHFFHSRFKSNLAKQFLKTIYILFNLFGFFGFFTIQVLEMRPPTGFVYDYVILPGIIWQNVQLIGIIPELILQLLVSLICYLWARREPKGLPKLFRAKKTEASLLNPVGLLILAFLVMGIFSYLAERDGPVVNEITLEYPGLPPQLEGFTVLLVTDLHYGRGLNQTGLERVVLEIIKLSPKLVLFAGDLTDCREDIISDLKNPLLRLKNTPFGVYAVTGDRDKSANQNGALSSLLGNASIVEIKNKRVLIHGAPITLIGFSEKIGVRSSLWPFDFIERDAPLNFKELAGPIPPVDNFTIALSHIPRELPRESLREINLYLTGHTRGGHFEFPGEKDINLAALFFNYSSGYYRYESMDILVSKGVSDSFLHFRIFAWPEINLITLKRLGPPRPEPGDTFGSQL